MDSGYFTGQEQSPYLSAYRAPFAQVVRLIGLNKVYFS